MVLPIPVAAEAVPWVVGLVLRVPVEQYQVRQALALALLVPVEKCRARQALRQVLALLTQALETLHSQSAQVLRVRVQLVRV